MIKIIVLSTIVLNIQYGIETFNGRVCKPVVVSGKQYENCSVEKAYYRDWVRITIMRYDPVLGEDVYQIDRPVGDIKNIEEVYH